MDSGIHASSLERRMSTQLQKEEAEEEKKKQEAKDLTEKPKKSRLSMFSGVRPNSQPSTSENKFSFFGRSASPTPSPDENVIPKTVEKKNRFNLFGGETKKTVKEVEEENALKAEANRLKQLEDETAKIEAHLAGHDLKSVIIFISFIFQIFFSIQRHCLCD